MKLKIEIGALVVITLLVAVCAAITDGLLWYLALLFVCCVDGLVASYHMLRMLFKTLWCDGSVRK